jgi:hypothetical protein
MQSTLTADYLLDNMPFFGDGEIEVPDLPLARNAIKLPLVQVAPEPAVAAPVAPESAPELKALRIARAITGETEMRLLARVVEGKATAYVVRSSTLHPYKHDDKVLQKGEKLMNEAQARATFDRLVAGKYPAVILGNKRVVPVHLDLL